MAGTLEKAAIDPSPGSVFRTRGRTITESDIVSFAALTGDWHPQHVDARWAKRSAFGERIAHGLLVLSYAAGLVDLDPERLVAVRGIRKVTFKLPIGIGDTISVEGHVVKTRDIDEGLVLVRVALQILREDDELAALAEFDLVWRT